MEVGGGLMSEGDCGKKEERLHHRGHRGATEFTEKR
jgi:hypothetical protein